MSYSRPIEMSEYPPRSVIWEADDYGLGADERARRTAYRGFGGSVFVPADGGFGRGRAGDYGAAGLPSVDPALCERPVGGGGLGPVAVLVSLVLFLELC